mgnify:CR=1 FL=1
MYTILICDDDKDIVSALDIYLTSEGYRTLKAYNLARNLDALTEEDAKIEIFPTVILALPDNVLKASVDETLAALDKYRLASKTDKEDEV